MAATMTPEQLEAQAADRRRDLIRKVAPFGVLLGLYLLVAAFEPNFFRWASVRALLEQWPIILMLASGQMLVVMTGRIDLSNASLASLSAMCTALWLGVEGMPAGLTIVLVILMATVIGIFQGLLHYHGQVASFVITLGGLGAWSGMALAISGGRSIIENRDTLDFLFDRWIWDIPNGAIFGALIALTLGGIMKFMPIGRQILAVGNGQLAAAYSGISVGKVMVVVFGASGFFAGLCGLGIVGWIDAASPSTADNLLLPAIAAVVIGGTAITGGLGGIGRTVVGAAIIAVLRVGQDVAGIEAKYQQVIYGALVIIAVAATIDRSRLKIVK